MKRRFIGFTLLSLLLILNGCARVNNSRYFQTRNNAYLATTNGPQLVVPPPLSKNKIKDYYVLNNVNGQAGIKDVPPGVTLKKNKAPAMTYLPGLPANQITMTSLAEHPALNVAAPLQQTWLLVGSGLRRQKITILDANYATQNYVIKLRTPYQVQLQAQDSGHTYVFITDKTGQAVPDAFSKKLLTSISLGIQGKSNNFWSSWL